MSALAAAHSQITPWPPDNSCKRNPGTTTGRRETLGTDIWHQQKSGKAKMLSGKICGAFKIHKGKDLVKKGKWFAATFHPSIGLATLVGLKLLEI